MKTILSKLTSFGLRLSRGLKTHFPLLAVVAVALLVVATNLQLNSWYSGWDNLHGEFDLWRYTYQVLGGAWLEHQGLGAPMNLAHLAEISRLPFLWLLSVLVPQNLIRISFIFFMYVLGGINMYLYLSQAWLSKNAGQFKFWLAALGGILYLLHLLTLQQFYIAFEMFTIQFAFLPLLLLVIHRFTKTLTAKTILFFAGLQLLLAPSGHTPTNFYLAVLASQLYGFCLVLPQGWFKALKTAVLIGILTLAMNSYWIVPNLYYTLHDARYVQESHDNRLFAPESVSSIREAGTWANFLQSRHYLFEWRDYNFATQQLEFIFNDWQAHLHQPLIVFLLSAIGVLTVGGLILLVVDKKRGPKRWAIILIYLGCAGFIWMGLFPTGFIFEQLYKSGAFTEAFRNPFTKLSIIYAVVSVVLFVTSVESLLGWVSRRQLASQVTNLLGSSLIAVVVGGIILTAWPAFQGHFISEKLQVVYPNQYQQMFNYLKTRDQQLRILPLPQLNHAGWEYYDWQFLGKGNGYQGMGFYFFGVPQPVLHRDSDRWVEASDFFYHELKFALDSQDVPAFERVVAKYQVDLILIDETRVEPGRVIDFTAQHALAKEAGFSVAWQTDFLSIYEKIAPSAGSKLFIPATISQVKTNAQRVIVDQAYQDVGPYLSVSDTQAQVIYPFADLLTKELSGVSFSAEAVSLTRTLEVAKEAKFVLSLPEQEIGATPVALSYEAGELRLIFPQTQLEIGDQVLTLVAWNNRTFNLANRAPKILVVLNQQVISLEDGQRKYQTLRFQAHQPLRIRVAAHPAQLPVLASGEIDGQQLQLVELGSLEVNQGIWQGQTVDISGPTQLKVTTQFPVQELKIDQNPAQNCAQPERGVIQTEASNGEVLFGADDFGVNCNGLELANTSSWSDYLLLMSGENKSGRGLKFFLNRSAQILTDDYIFSHSNFETALTLHSLATPTELIPTLNWEVRSFGQPALSSLKRLAVTAFPLQSVAGMQLQRVAQFTAEPLTAPQQANLLEYRAYRFGTDSLHLLELSCQSTPCVLGLDQSYDSAWLAAIVPATWWSIFDYQFLPHFHLNTWANGWQLPTGEIQVVIFYWPEVVSWVGMLGLVAGWGVLMVWLVKARRRDS